MTDNKPAIDPSATIKELRDRAHGIKPNAIPDAKTLDECKKRIAAACEGKPRGIQIVQQKSGKFGSKQYFANVIAGDVIAVGEYLLKIGRHDERTKRLHDGANACKKNPNGKPRIISQLVDELDHLLEVCGDGEREDR